MRAFFSSTGAWLGCGLLLPVGFFLAESWTPQVQGFPGLAYTLLILASYLAPVPHVPVAIALVGSVFTAISGWQSALPATESIPQLWVLLTIWAAAFVVVRGQRNRRAQRETEAKWMSIAENPFDYLAILDREGVYRYLNRAPNGTRVEDLVGSKTIYERVTPEAAPAVREALRDLFETGRPVYLEVRARYDDRWFGCNLGPIQQDGQTTGVSLLARDITARKKAVDALRESEERSRERFELLEDIYRSVPVGHCVLDGEFRYVRVNEWLADVNGVPAADHIGRSIHDVIPEFATAIESACRRVLDTQQPVLNIETEDQEPGSGKKRHWLASYFPWRGGAGSMLGVHVVVLDVTQSRNSARALEESEARFRAIFDHAAAGIALIDPDGCFKRVNPALCQALGYTEAELAGRSVNEVTYPDDVHLSQNALALVQQGRSKVARFQKRYRSRDGSVIWTKAMVAALNDLEKPPRHLVAVIADITEQIQAQRALRESEAVRRSIMESSPDYIAMLDRDGKYLFVNRVAPGYQIEKVIGATIYSVVSEPVARAIALKLDHVAETGNPDRFEFEHRMPDGGLVYFDTCVGPVLRDGVVTAFILSSRDVTDRRGAERALQESEDRYRNLTELSPNAILLKKNGRIVYVNSAGLALFGASSTAEIVGKSLKDLIHPDSQEVIQHRIAGLRERGDKPPLIQGRIVRLDRSIRDVEVAAGKIVDHGETAIQIVLRDVTERKKAQESLARSEQHFRSLIENSLDIFAILNNDGTSRYQSPSVERVLGYRPDELNGKDSFALIHPDDVTAARARFCERLRVPGTNQPIEFRVRHRDGSWRILEVVENNQLDNPAVQGIVCTARDVTERRRALNEKKQLEAQLWQAQKMEALGVLAGGIAHDFNNLLTSVVGFTTLAVEDLPEGASSRTYLDEAIGACDRARQLVQQMLTFGRRDTQRTQALDIAEQIAGGIRLLRATIPKAVEIRERIEPGCGMVWADPVQLDQVLMNLATNAYQAMAPGSGTLSVELAPVKLNTASAAMGTGLPPGKYVRLVVRDNGPGIDPAILDRIFEPFFTTKNVGEGSGLGLSVVHGIVTSHDGSIKVESTPGLGSAFSVYLPQLPEATVSPSCGRKHVLFVDDEESVVRLARKILERLGYRVTALRRSVKGLEVFRSQPASFDLVISDICMPNLGGVELAAAIREIRADIPIVLTTGFQRQVDAESAKRLGVQGVLFKPFTAEELGNAVRVALAHHKGEVRSAGG